MTSSPGMVLPERLFTLLIQQGKLTERGADELRDHVRANGAGELIPKASETVQSSVLAEAFSHVFQLPLYPNTALVGLNSPPAVKPTVRESGPDWLLTTEGFLYVVNPLANQQALLSRFRSKGMGIISRLDLVSAAEGTASIGGTPTTQSTDADTLYDDILKQSVKLQATDIHFEPTTKGIRVRFSINGSLMQYRVIELGSDGTIGKLWETIANKILDKSGGHPGSYLKPHDGQIVYVYNGRTIKLRVAMVPSVLQNQKDIVPGFTIRLLGNAIDVLDITRVGLPAKEPNNQLKAVRQMSMRKHGLILVTGPTGSGKTTTLAAVQQEMLRTHPNRKYMEVADPIEIPTQNVTQIQVNEQGEDPPLTFAKALKSMLRSAPDVIIVGEIRDTEVANVVLTAALTGHLVFSTIHTNSAVQTIARLTNMGCDRYIVAQALKGVTAQRLVPRLCEKCRVPARWGELANLSHKMFKERESEMLDLFYSDLDECYKDLEGYPTANDTVWIEKKGGCDHCKSRDGIKGRALVSEVLNVSRAIEDMISRGESSARIQEEAARAGFKEMWHHAMALVRSGQLSFHTAVETLGKRDPVRIVTMERHPGRRATDVQGAAVAAVPGTVRPVAAPAGLAGAPRPAAAVPGAAVPRAAPAAAAVPAQRAAPVGVPQ